GEVVAQITGQNLSTDTLITVGEGDAARTVTGIRAAVDGSSVDFIVPPSGDTGDAPTVVADITVQNGATSAGVLQNAVAYIRYQSVGGVNISAFFFEAGDGATVEPSLGAPHDAGNRGTLVIPSLSDIGNASEVVAGIVLNKEVPDNDKQTDIGTDLATGLINAGDAIPQAEDFSLHLYRDAGGNPAVGAATFTEVPLVDFARTLEPGSNNPVQETPVQLSFPVDGTGLSANDVREGLTLWGIRSEFDYVSHETSVEIDSPETAYESQVLAAQDLDGLPAEVDPIITSLTPDSTLVNTVVNVRLYALNGFTLRQNAIIPAEVSGQVRLANASGTSNGPVGGGTILRIVSPLGGLAWVDHIEFINPATGDVIAQQDEFVTPRGSDEFELILATPPAAESAIVDVAIFMTADSVLPAVTLESVFEYRPAAAPNLLLMLAGLLIALLGLAAGGNSGGGGGGACFIATAAYGTPLAHEIDVLRDVRDEFLLTNPIGTAFVDAYYHLSPPIADAVAASPLLRALVQALLLPVILVSKLALAMPVTTAFAFAVVAALAVGVRLRARRRRA
ncbi:MAG: hypothetical protein HYZ00_08115, partial [Candidatus Hydrogenedentes bacterium]|nr:hypothetical protein [Candidatus Hydrogenedentota bacterium]